MNLNLTKPCGNCPFKKVGAIDLCEGGLESIIDGILQDDRSTFQCHKTVHHAKGGTWQEDESGDGVYRPSGNESACAGAMIFLLKANSPSVAMRMSACLGLLDYAKLEAQFDDVIDVKLAP